MNRKIRTKTVIVCVAIAIATVAVYWPVSTYKFVNLDDGDYVTKNHFVQQGITIEGVKWAFMSHYLGAWTPLTWLSLMLDYQFFGLNPAGYHVTNVIIHILNAVFLFFVLRRLTGGFWRSAFAAAFFALHPLRVESVVWISERKDVLSVFFGMLAIWSYSYYVEKKTSGTYVLLLILFAMTLMAKPMLVMLPFVLLLLDIWPLNRLDVTCGLRAKKDSCQRTFPLAGVRKVRWLVFEKVPLFVLSISCCIATFLAHKYGGAMESLTSLPLKIRAENALVSYVRYIGKTLWPSHLAVFYPHPGNAIALWQILGAVVVLSGASWFVVFRSQRNPYLLVGWFWFLITLLPVIGLVQVGMQAMADRYTYFPSVGLVVMGTWGFADLFNNMKYRRTIFWMSSIIILLALMITSSVQRSHWKDSVALMGHAVQVTSGNYVAYHNLATALETEGQIPDAVRYYRKALEINPHSYRTHYNLGLILQKQGKLQEAVSHFKETLRARPDFAEAFYNLGLVRADQGAFDDAITSFSRALRLKAHYPEAHYALGLAYAKQGNRSAAITHYQKALMGRPDYAEAHNNLGILLAQHGQWKEAIFHFSRALKIKPDFRQARNNLNRALRAQREEPGEGRD